MTQSGRLIESEHEELLARERQLLDELIEIARSIEDGGQDHEDARVLRQHIDEPFLLVVVGEVKSGKSTFINTLLNREVCAVGPTPLTDRIHLLRYGESSEEHVPQEFLVERLLPIELLRDVTIVDTPGTNSILRQHGELTERFIPRSDLVLFLTSIDRPYSESENRFLAHISDHWRKKVVFLITKIDGRSDADVREVVEYVRRCCMEHHRFEPSVFPISARLAALEEGGGLDAVRDFVRQTLAGGEKMRLKLLSPLQSATAVTESLEQQLARRSEILEADFHAVNDLDRQVEQATRDLKERSFRFLTRFYDLFRDCERRAHAFFADKVRLRNLGLLRSSEKVRELLETEVLAELQQQFGATLDEAIDWLIREEITLYERCTAFLHEHIRPRADRYRLLGGDDSRFEYRREQIFGSIREGYRQQLDQLDVSGESRRLIDEANRSFLRQLGLTAGALAVGAGSVAFLTAWWAATAGVVLAVGVGLAGFALLPAVRRRAARRFSEKLDEAVGQLRETFVRTIEEEVDGTRERLRRGWEPFLLFHRTESQSLQRERERLGQLQRDAEELARRVDTLLGPQTAAGNRDASRPAPGTA